MKRAALALLILAACLRPAAAQTEEPIIKVALLPSFEVFKPGASWLLVLELTIRPPYHINADRPTEDYLIGTTVEFASVPGATFGQLVFPPAEMRRFRFSENPLAVYSGTVKITARLALAADFEGNEVPIEGTVGYQACNDESCLPPAKTEFNRKVPVEASTKPAASRVSVAPEKKNEPSALQQTGRPASRFEGKALLPLFLLVFLGGLALNLTPCVYPLIPITISYFGGQSEGKKGGAVLHAVLYVIGMAITYSVLGSIAAFTGSLFGAALQYPPVLFFIAAILILLSLSMFDVYELRLPAFLNRPAGGSQKGYLGTLFMGLTVGIVAAPCIGPFVLGLLTYVGNRASVLLGFSLFFVLALGLGLPFLFLGIFSGSLRKLPRSGAWMVWVRKIFGFMLIAMAVYFLKPLFPTALLYHLSLAMTLFVAGLYLAWLEPTQTTGKAFRTVRTVVGIIFFGASLLVISSGVQTHLDEALAAGVSGPSAKAIVWESYSEAKLSEAEAAGRPVFIDSFADWCIPCKEMDRLTFSRPGVIALSRKFVMLKADLTSNKDAGVGEFYRRYGIRGVPTFIFLKPEGTEILELRGTGFESPDVFLAKMKRALELSGRI